MIAPHDILNGATVLERAHALLQAGPVPNPTEVCGPWCPWCACAKAKSLLDDEHGVMLVDCIAGGGDTPLIEARWALGRWNHIDARRLDQAAALDILWTARQEYEG